MFELEEEEDDFDEDEDDEGAMIGRDEKRIG